MGRSCGIQSLREPQMESTFLVKKDLVEQVVEVRRQSDLHYVYQVGGGFRCL